jgi:hypothetical protein
MKKIGLSVLSVLVLSLTLSAQLPEDFDRYFMDKTMRIDYFHIGDAKEEIVTIDQVYEQGVWTGSLNNLIDTFNNGHYYVKIHDLSSDELIFSKGFDSYYGEYKTTDSAMKGVKRTYHETALIPYPKNKIRFVLEVRNRENKLLPLFSQVINPSGVDICKEPLDKDVKVFEMIESGHPHQKVDVAIIAEGYTKEEEEKCRADLERFADILFSQEPYRTYKDMFNIYGVYKPSEQSGCDEPRRGVFKNTALGASFNSLGSERYLLTEDNKALRDVAAHAPYDALFIMVNHERYGGGGIYNLFCTFTTDNQWHRDLFLHEFGHSFAGLGDEYYTSSVAYDEFYPRGVEPTEANITALLDPENLKWKDLITPGVGIPTPWEKEAFDKMDMDYQKIRQDINQKIEEMKRHQAPQDEIERIVQKSEQLSKQHADKLDAYLAKSKYRDKVGAFEGAGYSAKGLYRPMLDCLMFTKGDKPYCKVCERAIIRVIKHYSE